MALDPRRAMALKRLAKLPGRTLVQWHQATRELPLADLEAIAALHEGEAARRARAWRRSVRGVLASWPEAPND